PPPVRVSPPAGARSVVGTAAKGRLGGVDDDRRGLGRADLSVQPVRGAPTPGTVSLADAGLVLRSPAGRPGPSDNSSAGGVRADEDTSQSRLKQPLCCKAMPERR